MMSGASISYPHQCGFSGATPESSPSESIQSRTEQRSGSIAMATCYPPYEQRRTQQQVPVQVQQQKDYSRPLHVDCSVEYELPNTAKPPQGVRNEPLLMIHPSYFRKIESQRRSPFVNNLPMPTQVAATPAHQAKRHRTTSAAMRGQQPQLGAQYPTQYQYHHPDLVSQTYCPKRDHQFTTCTSSTASSYNDWTGPERSPDRPEHLHQNKHILSGKYRQYLRAHRLHPYSAIPLASTFPQVCYNV